MTPVHVRGKCYWRYIKFARYRVRKDREIKHGSNLWHQRTPHRSFQLILGRYSADTNEWRCVFVLSLWTKRKDQKKTFRLEMTGRVTPLITELTGQSDHAFILYITVLFSPFHSVVVLTTVKICREK